MKRTYSKNRNTIFLFLIYYTYIIQHLCREPQSCRECAFSAMLAIHLLTHTRHVVCIIDIHERMSVSKLDGDCTFFCCAHFFYSSACAGLWCCAALWLCCVWTGKWCKMKWIEMNVHRECVFACFFCEFVQSHWNRVFILAFLIR